MEHERTFIGIRQLAQQRCILLFRLANEQTMHLRIELDWNFGKVGFLARFQDRTSQAASDRVATSYWPPRYRDILGQAVFAASFDFFIRQEVDDRLDSQLFQLRHIVISESGKFARAEN